VASALALPLLVGCGSDEPDAASTTAVTRVTAPADVTTADLRIAKAALLRLTDLPFDWTGTPRNGQAPAVCAAVRRLRARPRAVSPGFVRGDGGIVHTVTIFPTVADADRIFSALIGPANASCLTGAIVQSTRMVIPADVEVGDPIVSRLHVEPLAQRIEAIRYTLPIRRGAIRTRFYEDYVTARVGRGISILWLRSRFVRPDDGLRARLTKTTVARLRATLSQ
jgi:hypothetical protein